VCVRADLPSTPTEGGSMLHTDDDIVVVTSVSGRCLDVSPSLVSMLGVPLEEALGYGIDTAMAPYDVAALRTVWDRVRLAGSGRSTIRVHHRNGQSVWLDISGQRFEDHPVYDRPICLFVARDVTDEVRAQEHMAESEQRWRLAFEHSPIGAALITSSGDISLANASLGKMLEQRPEVLAMMSLEDVTHVDDRQRDAEKMRSLLSGQLASYTIEKRFVAKSGRTLWGELTAAAVHDMYGEVH
jgi:PAS domain S-box-containing protein